VGNAGGMTASPVPSHGYMWSLNLTLPPLAIMFWKRRPGETIPDVDQVLIAND
jgi:hypothetical protein